MIESMHVHPDPAESPGARALRCLVFESHEIARRAWDCPADWRTLAAFALVARSEGHA